MKLAGQIQTVIVMGDEGMAELPKKQLVEGDLPF